MPSHVRHIRMCSFLGTLAVFPLLVQFYILSPVKERLIPGDTSAGYDRIKVFYNVYANPADDAARHRAKDYVKEQMAEILPDRHQVLIRSIGAKFKVDNATHIQHDDGGNEIDTLKLLWNHCQETDKQSEKVVYLHNKGSFHPSKENDLLRKWLTRAALSKECASMPLSCNVCSWRMSPLPHPHNSGNMWAARCEYIRKLIDPIEFEHKMAQFYNNLGSDVKKFLIRLDLTKAMVGAGRYAAEHWVHSHPSIQACDLSTSDFLWNYENIPEVRDEFELMAAPRYDWNTFHFHKNLDIFPPKWFNFEHRWEEYKFLYNETPPASWFGWKFYNDSIPADFQRSW